MNVRQPPSSRSLVFVLLVACSASSPGTTVPAASPAPRLEPKGPPTWPTRAEPTVLTDEQRRRDAAYEPLARAIVDAYPNQIGWYSGMVASWSPDGKRILFGSQRDGSPQIYAGDPSRPAEPPLAITSGSDRSVYALFTADGKSIVFARDSGGDENFHYWRANADGSDPVDLTPDIGTDLIGPVFPQDRPDTLVYSRTDPRRPETNIFERSLSGGEPRQVFSHPGMGFLIDITPDGKRALFVSGDGPSTRAVSELDLAKGTMRRLFPPAGQPVGPSVYFYSADHKRLLVSRREGHQLLSLDLATGEERARYTATATSGMLLAMPSPAGDYVAVHEDTGSHDEIHLHDARTLARKRTIALPFGHVEIGPFRPDGRELAVMMSLPDRPPDIYAIDISSGKVRPLRKDSRPGVDALPRVAVSLVETKAHDGLTIPLNVYLPASESEEPVRRRPTLVIFHGGPAWSSKVRWDEHVRFFVSLGYAVIEPNIRGSTGFGSAYQEADDREKRRNAIQDLATVNAWTRRQPWCDPERIAVWGASYGGYLTLMALTRQPTAWRAGVDLYGVADLRTMLVGTNPMFRNALIEEFGDPDKDAALLEELSPLPRADAIVAPLFVYAGHNDPRVPRAESDAIVQAMRDRGMPVEYMVAMDEGHNAELRHNRIALLTRTARFLADAMGPP